METILGIDPGIKYCGLVVGTPFDFVGINYQLSNKLDSPEAIAIQHIDLIESIYHGHMYYSNERNTPAVLKEGCHFSQINLEMTEYDGCEQLLKTARDMTLILRELINSWIEREQIDVKLNLYDGQDTASKRRELGLKKTQTKSSPSRMAHTNDALALLMMSHHSINRNNKPNFSHKPDTLTYEDIQEFLPDDSIKNFINYLSDSNNPATNSTIEKYGLKSIDICRTNKYSIMLKAFPSQSTKQDKETILEPNYLFSFQCEKSWDQLKQTNCSNLKFCETCNTEVVLASSPEQIIDLSEKYKCFALSHKEEPFSNLTLGGIDSTAAVDFNFDEP